MKLNVKHANKVFMSMRKGIAPIVMSSSIVRSANQLISAVHVRRPMELIVIIDARFVRTFFMGVSCVMITPSVSSVWHSFTILTRESVWLVMRFLIIARNVVRRKGVYSAKQTSISFKMGPASLVPLLMRPAGIARAEINAQGVTPVHISSTKQAVNVCCVRPPSSTVRPVAMHLFASPATMITTMPQPKEPVWSAARLNNYRAVLHVRMTIVA